MSCRCARQGPCLPKRCPASIGSFPTRPSWSLRDGRRVLSLREFRTVSAAFFDREGSLWLGSDAGGLHRFKAALFTTYSVPEGVGHPNVYATYVRSEER